MHFYLYLNTFSTQVPDNGLYENGNVGENKDMNI
jgi:hypothetical protein